MGNTADKKQEFGDGNDNDSDGDRYQQRTMVRQPPARVQSRRRFVPPSIDENNEVEQQDTCLYFLTVELQATYAHTNTLMQSHEPQLHLRSWKSPSSSSDLTPTPLYTAHIELLQRRLVEYPFETEHKVPQVGTLGNEIGVLIHERVIFERDNAEETGWTTRRDLHETGHMSVKLAVGTPAFLADFAGDEENDAQKELRKKLDPHLSYIIGELASAFESLVDDRDPETNQVHYDINRESPVMLVAAERVDLATQSTTRVCVLTVGGDKEFWYAIAGDERIPEQATTLMASMRLADATKARVAELLSSSSPSSVDSSPSSSPSSVDS